MKLTKKINYDLLSKEDKKIIDKYRNGEFDEFIEEDIDIIMKKSYNDIEYRILSIKYVFIRYDNYLHNTVSKYIDEISRDEKLFHKMYKIYACISISMTLCYYILDELEEEIIASRLAPEEEKHAEVITKEKETENNIKIVDDLF